MATNGNPGLNLRQLQDRLDALASLVYRLAVEVGTLNGTAVGALDGTLTAEDRAHAHQEVNREVNALLKEMEQAQRPSAD